ncbi:DUF803-domain-containing protein [Tothia fuscella]|uniref:DUF803-domain-containing protein n=1 Tax=Tothia fuscella TaxID=1048955 RepID=A0A9P4TW43_9PEZI|nr:DUF803-domain-containing protein [Tothia fuscella]
MILPTASIASGSRPSHSSIPSSSFHHDYWISSSSGGDSKLPHLPKTEDWSSLIGIVTAICGNILISIALNTQRYAHIKLNKQYAERQKLLKQAQKRAAKQRSGYGTQENSLFKDRVQGKGKNVGTNGSGQYEGGEDSGESEPLLGDSMYTEPDRVGEEADDPIPEEEAQKSYLKSPWWWAGIIMMTVGEAGNFLAYGFAPASIVSPLGVVALISNCIIAPFFLKEPFRKRDLLGVVIAVGGAVTVVLSASDSNPKLGPHEIWKLIGRWEFETYLGTTVGLICVLMWASERYGGKSIFIDIGLVGLFGGYTALSTKGVASMLSYTLFKALTFPVTYLLVAVLVFTAVMQIKYVNRALKRFDATQVIPTQFVLFTLSVIIGSAVLYRDFEKESGEDAGKFIGGCAMTFLGVYFITSARGRDSDDEEGYEEDEEEAYILVPGQSYDVPRKSSVSSSRRQSRILSPTFEEDDESDPVLNGINRIRSRNDGTTSLPPELDTPIITRTREPTFLSSGNYSQPTSMAAPSPMTESIWTPPEDQSNTTRRSMQKLLTPLSKIIPNQGSKPLPSTLKSTHSTPILPTEQTYQHRPSTPPNPSHIRDEPSTPITPHTQDGAHLLSRHSIADLIPGPLTSTLSSPLSAIVADSLRRGVDASSLRLKRRKRLPVLPRTSGLRKRGNSDTDARIGLLPDGSSSSVPIADSDQGHNDRTGRERSFSNTFGDFFKGLKRTKTGSQTDDEDRGSTVPNTPGEEPSSFR